MEINQSHPQNLLLIKLIFHITVHVKGCWNTVLIASVTPHQFSFSHHLSGWPQICCPPRRPYSLLGAMVSDATAGPLGFLAFHPVIRKPPTAYMISLIYYHTCVMSHHVSYFLSHCLKSATASSMFLQTFHTFHQDLPTASSNLFTPAFCWTIHLVHPILYH